MLNLIDLFWAQVFSHWKELLGHADSSFCDAGLIFPSLFTSFYTISDLVDVMETIQNLGNESFDILIHLLGYFEEFMI